MKRAIICFMCERLKKDSDSYWVKVQMFNNSYVIAELPDSKELKVKVCSSCAKKAGYKVKQSKPKHGRQGTKKSGDAQSK